ncbi:MAG TPA: IS110 family transposase [Acidimicrobiales bacterium]|nr:IS110 family transposase [Acidimicrobiales bacterium]
MEVIIDRCAGLDVHKKTVAACVRSPGGGRSRRSEVRTFGTFAEELVELRDWLKAEGVTTVAMEATGVYWKPVFYALEDDFELLLVNATFVKKLPGRKTDVKDAEWLGQLLECGLLRGSFVPPPVIRELRDLTRYRKRLVQERARESQRVEKLLEDTGIKVSAVASCTLGASVRKMLDALVAGERDPAVLAELAKGRLRSKLPELRRSLDTSLFREHHAIMLSEHLAHIDHLSASIERLDGRVDQVIAPFAETRDRLMTIPGVGKTAAEVIIAEIGTDMSRFPTAAHLASWAGMCPGNNESAGKHRSGHTTSGDPWLAGMLTECGWAARYTKDTYLAAQFWQIARRRGQKRASIAVGHSLLVIAWHIISTPGLVYSELGGDYFNRRLDPELRARKLLAQLQSLGLKVTVEPAAA